MSIADKTMRAMVYMGQVVVVGRQMRAAQKAYFKSGTKADQAKSKDLERQFDDALALLPDPEVSA